METGQTKWFQHEIGEQTRNTLTRGGKLILAGDRLILHNDYGGLLVADLTDDGSTLLASASVFRGGGRYWTVPVLSNGRLYCRTGDGRLVCLDISS